MKTDSRKRVSLFTTGLAGGGAERMMLYLAQSFVLRDINVDLVLTRVRGPYKHQIPDGVRVIDLNSSRIIAAFPDLVAYLRNEHPQVILSALKSANCLVILAREIARAKTRIVLSERSILSKAAANAMTRRGRFMPKLMRLIYPLADAVAAISEGVADDLASTIGLPRDDIEVIYNPAFDEKILEYAEIPPMHPWFSNRAVPIILGVGRFVAAKDFSTLIRAFAYVRRYQDLRLMILGDGEERSKLERLVRALGLERHVALPGFVENPFSYMKRAAVFVMTSRWEGFGNVLVEAMACGTPVISTDCPSGPKEILEGGKWGRLVPVGDSVALAYAIKATLESPGLDPRERAFQFTVNRAAERYLQLMYPRTPYSQN